MLTPGCCGEEMKRALVSVSVSVCAWVRQGVAVCLPVTVGRLAPQLRRATISNPVTGVLETAHYRISKR